MRTPWFPAALKGMLLFGGMFLVFKELLTQGVTLFLVLAACFFVGWITFFFEALRKKLPPIPRQSYQWVALAGFLCFGANSIALVALKQAPNPGYVLAVFSLQAVFGVFGARILFHSEIKPLHLTGTLLSVIGAAIIRAAGADASVNEHASSLWIVWALFGAFLFAAEYLSFKRVVDYLREINYVDPQLGARKAIWLVVTLLFCAGAMFEHQTEWSWNIIILLFLGGLLSTGGNIYSFRALDAAPNPGYVTAVFGTQSVVVGTASTLFFGSPLSSLAVIGMAACIAGLFFLSWEGKQSGKTGSSLTNP